MDKLMLKNQICFPLYAAANNVIRLYKPFLDKIGLTYTQYITMMVLWEENAINVKKLGEKLYLDSGTLTPLLKKLESNDFIRRTRDKSDERIVIVTLTSKGIELKKLAQSIPDKIASCINLDEEEMKNLYFLLYKVLNKAIDY